MGINLIAARAWTPTIQPELKERLAKWPKGHPERARTVTRYIHQMELLIKWSTFNKLKSATVKRRCYSQTMKRAADPTPRPSSKRVCAIAAQTTTQKNKVVVYKPVLDRFTNSYQLGSVHERTVRVTQVVEVIDLTQESDDESSWGSTTPRSDDGNEDYERSAPENNSTCDSSYVDGISSESGDDSDTSEVTITWSELEEMQDPMESLDQATTVEEIDRYLTSSQFERSTQELIDEIYGNNSNMWFN